MLIEADIGGQLGKILRFRIVVAQLVLAQRAVGTRGAEAALLGKRDCIIDAEVVGAAEILVVAVGSLAVHLRDGGSGQR